MRFKLIPVLSHLIFELSHLKHLGVRTTHPLQLAYYNKILNPREGCVGKTQWMQWITKPNLSNADMKMKRQRSLHFLMT